MSAKEVLTLTLDLAQSFLGIRVERESFRAANLIDVAIIIFLAAILAQPYFQIVDTLVQTSKVEGLNHWVLSSFKGSFIWMTIHLILLSLFGGINHPLIKFRKVVFGGLVIGLIFTFLLITMAQLLSELGNVSSILTFFFGIYPLIFVFAIRFALSKELKA